MLRPQWLVSLSADDIRTSYNTGRYPYPLFDVLTTSNRITLFVGSAVVMTLNAALLTYVYSRVNGRDWARAKPGAVKR
jgi:hypothetical protein